VLRIYASERNPISGLDRIWEFRGMRLTDFKKISTWRW